MQPVANWGQYPVVEAEMRSFADESALRARLEEPGPVALRGLGRSYGDASLYPRILSTLRFDKLLELDETAGRIACQAGVSLLDLLTVLVPRGWFPAVVPGTQYVTVGGAIAANIHGKNHHHAGGFGRQVSALDLLAEDDRVVRCSRDQQPALLAATCGGMGLTGAILRATLGLRRIETPLIREEIVRAGDLAQIMDLFEASAEWTYTVAWIDCVAGGRALGRSLMMRGEHARREELPAALARSATLRAHRPPRLAVPVNAPGWLLGPWSVRLFNAFYYRWTGRGPASRFVDYQTFFFPLDFVLHWNRIYGRRGFVQYQFVLPRSAGREGLSAILGRISRRGAGSFLAVLKLLGPDLGGLSFPLEGYTLALDFPLRPGLLPFLDELDAMVADFGGRIYLAKDARMSRAMFDRCYPEAPAVLAEARRWNPTLRFRSGLTDRLGLTS